MTQSKTYAESVKNNQPSGETPSNVTRNTNFRKTMREIRNEELAKESEKKLHPFNFILHGVD